VSLAQRITDDMKAALLGGDRFRGDTLRGLKAAILNEEVATGQRETGLSDADAEKIVAREVKKRRESIALYEQNGRPELAETEQKEVEVLQTYLPKQLNEAEIQTVIDEVVATLGDVSSQQMGQVIGAVKAKTGTAADGALVAQLVKTTLSGK